MGDLTGACTRLDNWKRGGGDRRTRRHARGMGVGAHALRYGVTALAILLFVMALRRSGVRTGRLAEQLETMQRAQDAQRRMLEAAAPRPRSRDALAGRLRDGQF